MKEFLQKHKYYLLILLFFLAVTGVSGYLSYKGQETWKKEQINPPTSTVSPTSTGIRSDQQSEINHQLSVISYQQPDSETARISTTLVVGDKTYTADISSNSTIYHFMKHLQTTTDFTFAGRDYGGALGFFVQEINRVPNDSQTDQYWIYSINGQKAKVGISNYILKQGDNISWTYESAYK